MNGHCSTCDVEHLCFYQYKPCDCCNYRKFTEQQSLPVGEFPGNVIPIRAALAAAPQKGGL